MELSSIGLGDKAIAAEMGISTETVRTYWQRIRSKTGASTRSEIIARLVARASESLLEAKRVELQRLRDEIDRRLEVERKLRASELLFRTVCEGSPHGIFITNPAGDCTYVNSAYERITGRSAARALKGGLIEAIHPEDREQFSDKWAAGSEVEGADLGEFRMQRLDGSLAIVGIRCACLRDGRIPLGHLGLVEDKTARKALEEDSNRMLSIIEATPDYIVSRSIEGNQAILNRAARALFGIDGDEAVTREFMEQVRPSWAVKCLREEAIPRAIEHGHWQGLTAFLDAENREIPVSTVMVCHKDDMGNPRYLSTISRDISAQVVAENETRARSEFIRRVADSLPEACTIFDLTTKKNVYTNRSFSEHLGYSKDEIAGMGSNITFQLIHPDDLVEALQMQAAYTSLQGSDVLEFSYRVKHADGTWRTLTGRSMAFARDNQGVPIQVITTSSISGPLDHGPG